MLISSGRRRCEILLRAFKGLHGLLQLRREGVVRADNLRETALEVAGLLSGRAEHFQVGTLASDRGFQARVNFARVFIRWAQHVHARLRFPRSRLRVLKLVFEALSSHPMKLPHSIACTAFVAQLSSCSW